MPVTFMDAAISKRVADGKPGYSYNQGLYLSAAAHMFAATGEHSYLLGTPRLLEALGCDVRGATKYGAVGMSRSEVCKRV